jgi:hypothetical protein
MSPQRVLLNRPNAARIADLVLQALRHRQQPLVELQ